MLRDFLMATSLANLWFFDVWHLFLIRHPTSYPYYHWKVNPAPILLATILDVVLLSTILFLAVTLIRRSRKQFPLKVVRLGFLLVSFLLLVNLLLIALQSPVLSILFFTQIHRPDLLFDWRGVTTLYSWLSLFGLVAGCVVITAMIHSLIYRRQSLIKLSTAVILILSPFALITFTQAASQWIRYRSGEQFLETKAAAFDKSDNRNSRPRILWLVFDEMDFRLSFVERPATLDLLEFDRLREESIFASNAYPPAGDTVLSLPALINGRLVSEGNRIAPNELMVTFGDSDQSVRWSTEQNVFSRARAMNLNTGLVGWYHPYCRIIGRSLTRCSWESTSLLFLANSEIADLFFSEDVSVAKGMMRVAGSVLLPEIVRILIPREEPIGWRKYFVQEFNGIHRRALEMTTDRNLDLVFVHYSIPHPPGIYDRQKNDFSFSSSSGYLDNLALADSVLKDLRREMENAGVWESTTLLISSDHRLRADRVWKDHNLSKPPFTREDPLVLNSKKDERVPFILKLAGERKGRIYEPPFNTVLSQELLLAVLSAEISKTEDVVEWLDRHRSFAESPYLEGEK